MCQDRTHDLHIAFSRTSILNTELHKSGQNLDMNDASVKDGGTLTR